VKFQRAAEALLQRFGSSTSHWAPNALTDLGSFVVPVIGIGQDRIDDERATWHFETLRAASVGNAGFIALTPITGTIELLSVIACAPVGAVQCDLQVAPAGLLWATPPTVAQGSRQQSTNGTLRASCDAGYDVVPFPGVYPIPALACFSFPIAGTLVDPGFSIYLKASATNVAISGGFWWRNA
jgi:hypothetical protein